LGEISVAVERVSKLYRLRENRSANRTLREALTDACRAPLRLLRTGSSGSKRNGADPFWALKDVSFEIRCGEVVGIIGHNGAGKSTLLRILSRITYPTSGSATVYGRVGALLEVGTGFHGELTGRENVFLSGSILGMRQSDIRKRFDAIVDFAEVDRFIDTPVKHYSTGMYLRLAFAVAAHLEPEILIVDEALAVGDAAFQRKCLGKMGTVAKEGRTVLLVTHNMGFLSRLTSRALVLARGEVKFFGDTTTAIDEYLRTSGGADGTGGDLRTHPHRLPGMTPTLTSARTTDAAGRDKHVFSTGEDWFLEVGYEGDDNMPLAGAAFDIVTRTGTFVSRFETYMRELPPYRIPQSGRVRFRVAGLPLLEGDYLVNLGIGGDPRHFYDCVPGALSFVVEKSDPHRTGFMLTRQHGICALDATYEAHAAASASPLPFDRRRIPERRRAWREARERRRRAPGGAAFAASSEFPPPSRGWQPSARA
jgi:homopolymeric O-antigen transport system ATP-binding protein